MDPALWREVTAELAPGHRCIVPALPLGAHRRAVRPDADLSLPGIAGLVCELIERLGLEDLTLVGNDTGGAVAQMVMRTGAPRVARVVLVSCEAFDNLPPGLTGRTLALTGKLPPRLFGLFMQQLRLRPVRRLPIAFGWLTRRGDATTKQWMRPIQRQPEIRRDAVRALRAVMGQREILNEAAPDLARFDRPVLVVWAAGDRVMPPAHGRRLAELIPDARLVEVEDSYTLVPLDQPGRLAGLIRSFVRDPATTAA
jgi:pimeloyl-ACP methyl ester carboxylesterase